MNRKEQQIAMLNKLSMILSNLPKSNSIRDISNKTGIPQTTVYNYLHNDKLICDFLGMEKDSKDVKEFFAYLKIWSEHAKKMGPIKGNMILEERYGQCFGGANRHQKGKR